MDKSQGSIRHWKDESAAGPGDRREQEGSVPDPYLLRPGKKPEPISAPGPRLPLGVREKVAYASRTIEIGANQRLLLMSDGLPEACDASGEPLGYQALEEMILDDPSLVSPSEWLTALFDRVQRHTERTPDDDWTAAMLVPLGLEEGP